MLNSPTVSKILYGPVVTDSRGSIGGTTFTNGRSGATTRARRPPRNAKTQKKSLVLARGADLAQAWFTDLTQTERDAWIALAVANPRADVWGNNYALTGLQLYVSLNQRRFQAGLSRIDTAPASITTTALATATLTATAPSTLSLAFTATPLTSNQSLYVFATPNLSPGRKNFGSTFRYLATSSASQGSPFSIGSAYTSLYGALQAGRRVAVRAAILTRDSGALGTSIIASAVVS